MSKFKIGDKVRIVRKIELENGWKNEWLPEMDIQINTGLVFTINKISQEGVYFTEFSGCRLGYPLSSLELVETNSVVTRNKNYQYLNGAKLGSGGPLTDLCLTIATTITKYSDGEARVDWAVAFKHPKDKFNKELARCAVESRETKELLLQKGFDRNDIVFKILCDLTYHEAFLSDQYKKYVLFLVAKYSNNILRKELFK
jgi:hypothetical protein